MIKYLWQLPQHLLALITLFILRKRITIKTSYEHTTVYRLNMIGWGISLGNYILLDERYDQITIMHEFGHSVQSLYFGPLYLIVIGLPSIIMNILTRLKILKYENYYKRWPENWADKLGKVKR